MKIFPSEICARGGARPRELSEIVVIHLKIYIYVYIYIYREISQSINNLSHYFTAWPSYRSVWVILCILKMSFMQRGTRRNPMFESPRE